MPATCRRCCAVTAPRCPNTACRCSTPSDVNDRKALSDKISDHKRHLDQRRVDEERRLLYVALTRAEDTLLLSGHHWGATESKPRGPSDFLCRDQGRDRAVGSRGRPVRRRRAVGGRACRWRAEPVADKVIERSWPADPAARERGARGQWCRAGGIRRCRAALDGAPDADDDGRLGGRRRRAAGRARPRGAIAPAPPLPAQLSVSALVDIGRDPARSLQRLQRRLPARPDPHALLGTAFHDWVQRFFHAERLFDLDDLPGAVDATAARRPKSLAELQAAFAVSPWAARTPIDVEVPFDMVIGGTWCGAASTRSSPTTTVAPPWSTGRPATARHAGGIAAARDSARRIPAGVGGDCTVVPWSRCGRRSTTCAAAARSRPNTLPGADDLAALLEAA